MLTDRQQMLHHNSSCSLTGRMRQMLYHNSSCSLTGRMSRKHNRTGVLASFLPQLATVQFWQGITFSVNITAHKKWIRSGTRKPFRRLFNVIIQHWQIYLLTSCTLSFTGSDMPTCKGHFAEEFKQFCTNAQPGVTSDQCLIDTVVIEKWSPEWQSIASTGPYSALLQISKICENTMRHTCTANQTHILHYNSYDLVNTLTLQLCRIVTFTPTGERDSRR